MRGIFFDMNALVYGPEGADFLSEVLRAEGIAVEPVEVTAALQTLPPELQAARENIRTEAQENDYNLAMLPALLAALGQEDPTEALIYRLVETVHEYHAWHSMYPETLPVLEALKQRGFVLGVVANWAPSLHRFIREFELDGYFKAVVAAQEVGLSKPDPFPFHQALKQAGLQAEDVVHVGPGLQADVTGATRAGLLPVWLNRTGIHTGHEVLTITDLRGLLTFAQKAGEDGWN
jgi:HAD superfamily hydrolase (TIGR01509 family)